MTAKLEDRSGRRTQRHHKRLGTLLTVAGRRRRRRGCSHVLHPRPCGLRPRDRGRRRWPRRRRCGHAHLLSFSRASVIRSDHDEGLLCLVLIAGCGDDPPTASSRRPAVPRATTSTRCRIPNDLRRHDDGTLDLSEFPTNSVIAQSVRSIVERDIDGFGLNQAIFARFSSPLDPASLPTPEASITDAASAGSPDRVGSRTARTSPDLSPTRRCRVRRCCAPTGQSRCSSGSSDPDQVMPWS